MKRSRPLSLEVLEDRLAPATWGNPWPDGQNLTLSFVRDGTPVAGQPSTLFQTLNKVASTADWEREVLRAFQTWAAHAQLNIGLVGDQGQALGSSGRLQGDERFGDFRIAGYPMSDEALAIASPFAATAGTWAGDVRFNTAAAFGMGTPDRADLFTVALQEAGHALGLAPSNHPTSVMYGKYNGPRTGPSAADIAALQALYGQRTADAREGLAGNGTFGSASPLTLVKIDDDYGIGAEGDITSTADADFYRFTAPVSGTLHVSLKTGGLSLLTPRVTIYDSAQRPLDSATDLDPLTGELALKESVSRGRTYYVKVQSGRSDAFGVGSYQLETVLVPSYGLLGGLLNVVTGLLGGLVGGLLNNDNHSNDTIGTALRLPDSPTPSRFDHAYQGSISDSKDVDFYQVTAPLVPAGMPNVMKVMVWGLDNARYRLIPAIRVYDALQRPVPAEVLVRENGTVVLQVANAISGAAYFVEVAADNPAGSNNVGNYFLGIDFGRVAERLETFAQDTLHEVQPRGGRVMTLTQTKLFHFVLSATAASEASVRLTIYNQKGGVAGTVTAQRGQSVSLTVTLVPGAYWFNLETLVPSGSSVPNVGYDLRGVDLSDPIGPTECDESEAPATMPDSTYSWYDTSDSDTGWGSDWWYDYQDETVASEDPYSDPYQDG
jgi:hypothetical protein